MDVRLGTSRSDESEPSFGTGEFVIESGIYLLQCHEGRSETIALIRGQVFPECPQCGDEGRFRLLHAAPYILDDPDFAE